MQARRVVVVAETSSLAASLSDLLRSAGIAADMVTPLEALETLGERAGPVPAVLLLVASNRRHCPTARRWLHGEFPGTDLVVVGPRDPALAGAPQVPRVALPLRPEELLELVRLRLGPS